MNKEIEINEKYIFVDLVHLTDETYLVEKIPFLEFAKSELNWNPDDNNLAFQEPLEQIESNRGKMWDWLNKHREYRRPSGPAVKFDVLQYADWIAEGVWNFQDVNRKTPKAPLNRMLEKLARVLRDATPVDLEKLESACDDILKGKST